VQNMCLDHIHEVEKTKGRKIPAKSAGQRVLKEGDWFWNWKDFHLKCG
jgi:hypothetical protein